ncbi:MAG: CaiB/BaiF CoA transferase family protein [Acidimicrobiales bacterium]
MSSGPLSGVRIIEVAQVISGPWGIQQLAEQGADVIKVEPLTGDSLRLSSDRKNGVGSIFFTCNRSKRSVALDLTKPGGLAVLERLVAGADVFVQNFRPGKADKLGIGYAALSAINPSLIYASISGVGATGPLAHRPTYDFVIQAIAGIADAQRDAQGQPHLLKNYVVDKATAQVTAQAITAALFARERDPQRRGQHVELSLLDVGIHHFWVEGMMQHTLLAPDVDRVPSNLDAYDAYPTADGAIAMLPIVAKLFERMAHALQRPQWLTDPRFAEFETRRAHIPELCHEVRLAMADRSTEDLMAAFEAHDFPASPVLDAQQMAAHPQVQWNGCVMDADLDHLGPVRYAKPPAQFSTTPGSGPSRGPLLGQHTAEVLHEVGYSQTELASLRHDGVIPPTSPSSPA